MKKYPKIIEDLILLFNELPGIGPKTSERLAYWVLGRNNGIIERFLKVFSNIKSKIKVCENCRNYTENSPCQICSDKTREQGKICVVSSPQEQIILEATGEYRGRYFILGGCLNPLEGMEPKDLNIKELVDTVEKNKPDEIILALNPTIEGEATISYIKSIFSKKRITISRLAQGLPSGATLEFSDQVTLINAINGRKKID